MAKEVLKSELDLFKKPFFQNSIENSHLIQFHPVSAISQTNNLEFFIPGSPEFFIDMENFFLWINAKLVKQDGTDYDATQDNRYSLINYGLMTIWQQLDISLNNTIITQSTNTFPYTSYLDALTKFDNKSHHTYLRSSGYLPYVSATPDLVNTHLAGISNQSKTFKLYGRIFNDLFESGKYLLNGVSMKLNFIYASDLFALMGSPAVAAAAGAAAIEETKPKLKILDASLFVRHVKVTPGVFNAIQKGLQMSNSIYPIRRRNTVLFNLPPNQSFYTIDNIFMGQICDQLIIGLVEHDANIGNYQLNPLAFKNFDLNYLCIYVNGEPYPRVPYTPNYANNSYEREYYDFHNEQGLTNGLGILDASYTNFKEMVNFYCFNLNQDFSNSSDDCINLSKEGSIRVEVKFVNALNRPLKLICFGRFNNNIEIDRNRNVITDF